jgi:hypothetical protein
MSEYSYSTNEENYDGTYASIKAACDAAAADVGVGGHFWVGENVPPPQPEFRWDAEDWLEQVSCQDEYSIDAAVGWDQSTKVEREELEALVRPILAAWLDRHGNRPQFWMIEKPQKYYVAGKVGDVFEVEAL